MKILLIGPSGTLGAVLHDELSRRGHQVIGVGRRSGDLRYDIADPEEISRMYAEAGTVDAVVSAAGEVPYKVFADLRPDDFRAAFAGKVLSQIALVSAGLAHVAERGSFTLITGVTARDPIVAGAAASMASGALEAFVRAAAIEIAPRRINAVSPSVFTESLDDYGDFFPGFPPVDLATVAQSYVRSVEGADTGRVFVPQ